jgi:multicomponent Na+:H+ antiporter subunit G
MNEVIPDAIISLLLIGGVGFGGIAVIGLLLFPDIRSRMYTAARASLIGVNAVCAAGIVYGLFLFISNGQEQYPALVFHSVFLIFIVLAANFIISKIVLERVLLQGAGPACSDEMKDHG